MEHTFKMLYAFDETAYRSTRFAQGYPASELSSESGYLGLIDDFRFYNKSVSKNFIETLYGFEQSADSSRGAHFIHVGPSVDLENDLGGNRALLPWGRLEYHMLNLSTMLL